MAEEGNAYDENVSALNSTAWQLVDADENSETSENSSGTLQYRSHHVLVRKRRHQGVSAWNPATNETGTSISFTNGGVTTLQTNAAHTYVCTGDRMRPDPENVDFWVQEQTWEYFAEWADMPAGWIN